MKQKSSRPMILLIHAPRTTVLRLEQWVERFRGRAFDVIAESWPGSVADLWEDVCELALARALSALELAS